MFRPHLMQGWSPDFVSTLTEEAVRDGLVDEVVPVSGTEALRLARALAREEGILCGISSGATLTGALEVCRRVPPGTNVLCMLTDTGERYLSTDVFEAYRTGALHEAFTRAGAAFDATVDVDPDTLLPAWLHPRRAA